MSNMSYCKFQNTLGDLEDCWASWENDLSGEEEIAREQLVQLCKEIAEEAM